MLYSSIRGWGSLKGDALSSFGDLTCCGNGMWRYSSGRVGFLSESRLVLWLFSCHCLITDVHLLLYSSWICDVYSVRYVSIRICFCYCFLFICFFFGLSLADICNSLLGTNSCVLVNSGLKYFHEVVPKWVCDIVITIGANIFNQVKPDENVVSNQVLILS